MFYYEVIPGDRSYHGQDALTYCSEEKLKVGQIVVVKLRTKNITGFVVAETQKPSFNVKPIEKIIENALLPKPQIELSRWLSTYYPAPTGSIGSLFMPHSINLKTLKNLNKSTIQILKNPLPNLTKNQQNILDEIERSSNKTFILHGDTGTGKTRLYIELAKKTITAGKSVLILTPEIGLTPQLLKVFSENFKNIYMTHSELSDASRREIWRNLGAASGPQLLIGPRSALFMPLKDVGLVVIDEFHDGAYKQEQAPYYRATRVASKLRELHGATLVLGSATPPVEDYYFATSKHVPVLRMIEKPSKLATAKTKHLLVNLADKTELSRHSLLSKTLLAEIRLCLDRGEQTLLFLNKRGSARLLVCQSCGWFAECPRCDLPYTYHGDKHSLQCHTCGNHRPAPNSCEQCGSSEIIFKSPGTKAIEEAIKKEFPGARVARFDSDNLIGESIQNQHDSIQSGEIDILIGTQLLAKGHDLPKLSLVGIILADGGLQFPDYSSEERSYQLLHQLAGRVGRGHTDGTIVVQTYSPESPLLKAIDHNESSWESFYESQLKERESFNFPPFCYVLKLEVSRAQSRNAQETIEKLAKTIQQSHPHVHFVGPSPSFIAKRGNAYYWQLIIKSSNRSDLTNIIRQLPARTNYDLDPLTLL